MYYTLFELERIEKILTAKLSAASEAYQEAEKIVIKEFKAHLVEKGRAGNGVVVHGDAVGYQGEPVSGVLSDLWEKFKEENTNLKFLHDEVALFREAMDSLQSYWNHSTEVFIDNMRRRISEKEKA